MKMNASLRRSIAAAALVMLTAVPAFSQSATTDPVGFVTMSIAGNGSASQPAYTFTTLGLANVVAWQSTTTSVGGSTSLVDASSTWADNAYNGSGGAVTHYVEIVSGPGAGTMYDITGTSASSHTLTLSQPLAASIVAGGSSYRVRPHWTLASVFGATNQNGLSGGDATSADQIQLFRAGGYVIYYYQTAGLGGTGWRQAGAPFVDASATVIYPNDGIVVVRKQNAPVSLVIQGAVKTGQTSIPVTSGFTLLGNVYAAAMTLGNSNLYTGDSATGLAGGDSTSADQVMFWNGTTGFNIYYYQTSGLGGTGWRQSGAPFVNASDTSIPVGAALFVKRNGAPFKWVAPQTPASFN